MKNISIISALIFFAALAFAENNIDLISMSKVSNELCELQIEFNEVVERLTPKGQKIVRSLVFDFQNELFNNVIHKIYANVKSSKADVLANLTAAEGDNITAFWNVIGFNNDTVSRQQIVDICQLKTNVASLLDKLQPSSRIIIGQLFGPFAKDAQTGFGQTVKNFEPKAMRVSKQLIKGELLLDILKLRNILEHTSEVVNIST